MVFDIYDSGQVCTYDAILNAETKLIFDVRSFDEDLHNWGTGDKL